MARVSSFTTPLLLEVADKERDGQGLFNVYAAFSYDVGYLGSGETIVVPAGFTTDLCTLPRLARPFIATSGKAAKPALLHDYLLVSGDPRALPVFREALVVAGVSRFTRWIMVAAVWLWAKMSSTGCPPSSVKEA